MPMGALPGSAQCGYRLAVTRRIMYLFEKKKEAWPMGWFVKLERTPLDVRVPIRWP